MNTTWLKIIGLPMLLMAAGLIKAAPPPSPQATASSGCTEADPRIAHVITVNGAGAIAVGRRSTQLGVVPTQALCSSDLVLPSKASAIIMIERRHRQKQVLDSQKYYFFDTDRFVAGRPDSLSGKAGGIVASLSDNYVLFTRLVVREPSKYSDSAKLSAAIQDALNKTGRFQVVSAAMGEPAEGWLPPAEKPSAVVTVDAKISTTRDLMGGALLGALIGRSNTLRGALAGASRCPAARTLVSLDLRVPAGNVAPDLLRSSASGAATVCSSEPKQAEYDAAVEAAAEKAAARLASAAFPTRLTAVNPDGSFTLDSGVATLTAGAVLSVDYAVVAERKHHGVPSRLSTALGLVKVTSVGEKSAVAVPITSFLVAPPVGATLSPHAEDKETDRFP